jgi:hypothetical protein
MAASRCERARRARQQRARLTDAVATTATLTVTKLQGHTSISPDVVLVLVLGLVPRTASDLGSEVAL